MLILRCTRRLLRDTSGRIPAAAGGDRSDSALGDWYATRLNIAQQRYVLAVNGASLLALVVPARDLATLPDRLTAAAASLFAHLGVRAAPRRRELGAMGDVRIAPTDNRSVVASMTDLGWLAYDELYDMPHRPGRTLDHINIILASAPIRARDFRAPGDIALEMMR